MKEKNTFAVVVGILSIVASVIVSAIVASRTARSSPPPNPVRKGTVYMARRIEAISNLGLPSHFVGGMVGDICNENAKRYFDFPE